MVSKDKLNSVLKVANFCVKIMGVFAVASLILAVASGRLTRETYESIIFPCLAWSMGIAMALSVVVMICVVISLVKESRNEKKVLRDQVNVLSEYRGDLSSKDISTIENIIKESKPNNVSVKDDIIVLEFEYPNLYGDLKIRIGSDGSAYPIFNFQTLSLDEIDDLLDRLNRRNVHGVQHG